MYLRKKDYEELLRLAYFDLGTGFYNRNWFEKNFVESHPNKKISLAMVDINYLKHINDNYGHAAGDKKIIEVGNKLSKYSKVIRWGGDEFYCIIDHKHIKDFEDMCKDQNEFAYAIEENFECKNIVDTLAKLDEKMYECKSLQKKIHHYKADSVIHFHQE